MSSRYSNTAKALHWTCSLMTITMIALGFIASSQPKGPMLFTLMSIHKSLGLTLLAIMLFRAAYRLTHNYPAALPAPQWQQKAASLTHLSLYVLVIGTCIIGWAMSALKGYHTQFWGWFNVSLPLGVNKGLAHIFSRTHTVIAWTLIGLISLHVLAAIYHHVIQKDDTLKRML